MAHTATLTTLREPYNEMHPTSSPAELPSTGSADPGAHSPRDTPMDAVDAALLVVVYDVVTLRRKRNGQAIGIDLSSRQAAASGTH